MKFSTLALMVCLVPVTVASAYDPVGKRDPFKPALRAVKERRPGPLEAFDLDVLHLVAVVVGTSRPLAMVETPTGVQYVILVGTQIGRNQGRVIRITKDRVIIREKHYDRNRRLLVGQLSEMRIEKKSKQLGADIRNRNHPWATIRRGASPGL